MTTGNIMANRYAEAIVRLSCDWL